MDYLLWFDDSSAPVADRVARAARFYEVKHGRKPTRCLLPKGERTTSVTGVICVNDPLVLPGHLWLGTENEPVGADDRL